MRNIYTRNSLRGPTCLPLNTQLYISLTMTLHENMKPIEHVEVEVIQSSESDTSI